MCANALTGMVNQEEISSELLNMLPFPLLLVDQDNRFVWLNPAAESFFKSSTAYLAGHAVAELVPADSPFFSLLDRVRQAGRPIVEKELGLFSPKLGVRTGTIQMVPILAASEMNESLRFWCLFRNNPWQNSCPHRINLKARRSRWQK